MALFVVNRHIEDQDDQYEQKEITEEEERSKLDKVLKRIEKNKKIRNKQKERELKVKLAKQKTLESRQAKRELKAKIIPVPENSNDEFIDKNIIDAEVTTEEQAQTIEKAREIKKLKVDVKDLEGFTVLGAENFAKRTKLKRVLPKWLAHPTVISVNLQNLHKKVSEVKRLDKGIRKLLKANGIKYFFPVQAEVIPWLLEANKQADVMFPRDICVSAPTGSGKTLAFVLPIIQALRKYSVKKIRALVILPTQDLAMQVFKTFKTYTQNTKLDVCLITGNHPFATEQTQLIIENTAFGNLGKVDILICTAGRLVDHLKLTKGFSLQYLEFLVIDEADRVLDTVQNDWLYHLEKHIHQEEPDAQSGKVLNLNSLQKRRPPQKLLFSATLSQDPEKLQKLSLFQPKLFTSVVGDCEDKADQEQSNKDSNHSNLDREQLNAERINEEQLNVERFIGKYTTPRELTEKYVVSSLVLKPLVLYKLIKLQKLTKSIIFAHSLKSAHRLTILLKSLFKDELTIEEISSNLMGTKRTLLIDKFSNGNIDLLVCTDSLTRGIDLPDVQCVVSYSAPRYLKTYIHRAGRTARAGKEGVAVTLVVKSQLSKFKSMLEGAGKNIEELTISEEDLEPLEQQYQESLQELKDIVEEEWKSDLKKNISKKRVKNFKRKRKSSENMAIPKNLIEKYIVTSLSMKPFVLYKLIKLKKLTKTIIFAQSWKSAHKLTILLKSIFKNELNVEEVSSDLIGQKGTLLVDSFSEGKIDLLVCTDLVTRGIHLPGVQCVVSYSAPRHLKTYIHRANRITCLDIESLAITLVLKSQLTNFKTMLENVGRNIEELTMAEEDLEPFEERYKQSLLTELNDIVEKLWKLDLKVLRKQRKHFKNKQKCSVSDVFDGS